jgi:hypothetical protein
MDIKEIIKKPAFKWSAAAVGVVALFVFLRRPATGGLSGSSAVQSPAAGGQAYSGTGRLDTTGSDVASWLGQYSGGLQNQLNEYGRTLTDATSSLALSQVYSAQGGQRLSDVAAAAGVSVPDLMAINPNLGGYLKDANQWGFISPSNPAGRADAGPSGPVFWASAPVKLPAANKK